MFKRSFGAIALVALAGASGVLAQDFKTSEEILRHAPKTANAPTYAIAFGHVLARFDKRGTTKFNYTAGKVQSEVLPNSVIGTYLYDKKGKFQGVAYNDGRKISVAYNPNGSIAGLTTNFRAKVTFKKGVGSPPKPTSLQGFFTIQNGIGVLNNYCISDDPDGCAVIISAESGGAGGDWGGVIEWSGEPTANGEGSGGGGGGGEIYPRTGSAYPTVEECQQYVCEDSRAGFDRICATVARPGADRANCYSKSMEYYSKCLRSCEYADWSWLSTFNFIWG